MKVVHCKKEYYDVLIDRTTKWGNPFIIGRDGDRDGVVGVLLNDVMGILY